MTPRGAKLRHCMCKCRERCDVEDGECVFAILDTAFGEDESDEVDAGLA